MSSMTLTDDLADDAAAAALGPSSIGGGGHKGPAAAAEAPLQPQNGDAATCTTPRLVNGTKNWMQDGDDKECSDTEDVTSSSSTSVASSTAFDEKLQVVADGPQDDHDDADESGTAANNTVDEEDAKQIRTFDVEVANQAAGAGASSSAGASLAITDEDDGEDDRWSISDECRQVVSFDLEELGGGGTISKGDFGTSVLSPLAHDKANRIVTVVPMFEAQAPAVPLEVVKKESTPLDDSLESHSGILFAPAIVAGISEKEASASDLVSGSKEPETADFNHSERSLQTHSFDASESSSLLSASLIATPVASNKKIITPNVDDDDNDGLAKSPELSIRDYWRDLDSKGVPLLPPAKEFGSPKTAADRKGKFARQTRYATVTNIPTDVVRLTRDQKQAVDAELSVLKKTNLKGKLIQQQRQDDGEARSAFANLTPAEVAAASQSSRNAPKMAKETRYATVTSIPTDAIPVDAVVVPKNAGCHKGFEKPDKENSLLASESLPNISTVVATDDAALLISMSSQAESTTKTIIKAQREEGSGNDSLASDQAPKESSDDSRTAPSDKEIGSSPSWGSRAKSLLTGTALVTGGTLCSIIFVATIQRRSMGAPMR